MALRADDVDLGRDRDLVARFQGGDPEAFEDLYRRYFGRLRRYCQRHTHDGHEAEEVAQEAFVKALRAMHTLAGERRFYPWMTVIARRIIIDRHRKQARLELTDEPDLGSVDPDVDHLFAAVDAAHVRAAMANLGPRHREVLELRETDGMSYADIAAHLDVPVTTVEALLHRARKALRREFTAVGGERRGVWGLPLAGLLATRLASIRDHVGERWAEIATVAAPVAVGAVTAAVVLGPATTPPDPEVRTASHAAAIERSEPPSTPDEPVVVTPPATATPGVLSPDDGPATGPAPAAPAVDAGPVDVFVGPEATEQAADHARDMPLHTQMGPATGGADGAAAGSDVDAFVAQVLHLLTGTAEDPGSEADRPADAGWPDGDPDTDESALFETLLGGDR